jgi:predicted dehydrogenase
MTIESVSHDIDLMQWILGDIHRVSALARARTSGFDDALCATLQTKEGAIGSLQVCWSSHVEFSARHVIVGTRGTLAVESPRVWDFSILRYRSNVDTKQSIFEFPCDPSMRHAAACRHFVNVLTGREENALPLRDGQHALEICSAMLDSNTSGGKFVDLAL